MPWLADDFTDGYHPGGQLRLELGAGFGQLHLGLALVYARLPVNEDGAAEGVDPSNVEGEVLRADIEGGSLNLLAAILQGRWDLGEERLRPYLIGGGGVAFGVPATTRIEVELQDDAGDISERSFERKPDSSVDPVLLLGLGATDVSGPFEIFGQLHASVLLGDEVVPIAMLSVGVGI